MTTNDDEKVTVVDGDISMANAIAKDINEIFRRHDQASEDKVKNCLSAMTAIFNIIVGLHVALAEGLQIPREIMLLNFDRNMEQVRNRIIQQTSETPSNETDPHKH